MSSGKQVSFQFGEVSPLERFRGNDAEYSSALYALYNMHVKRAGGVTKMPGSKILYVPDLINQNVPAESLDYQRYKLFSYPYSIGLSDRYLQKFSLRLKNDSPAVVTIELFPNNLIVPAVTDENYYVPDGEGLAGVKAVYADGKVFLHGLWSLNTSTPVMIEITDINSNAPVVSTVQSPSLPAFTLPLTAGNLPLTGGVLATGVQYLITLEYTDGLEIPYLRFDDGFVGSSGYDSNGFMVAPAGGDLIFPGEGVLTGFSFTVSLLGTLAPKLKNVNIYRAPITASSASAGSMILAAKLPSAFNSTQDNPVTTYFYNVSFNDTGASTPLVTPPVDFKMFIERSGEFPLEGTSCSAIYQGRHIIGFDRFDNPNIRPGEMAVSRAGGISQIARPIINRNIEGFSMSIPIGDGSPVRQLISAERVISFSDNGTYVIQGGDNGILTPTSINPIKLSSEGASAVVAPVKINQNVIYLNSKHTKLMAVFFGDSYQAGVIEIGKLSEHLLQGEKFIEMNVLPGADNVILLLKQSGDLISVTLNDDGAAGFSRIELEGDKVESMTLQGEPNKEALLLSIIRNGVRYWATIGDNSSIDEIRVQSYANAAAQIGYRLLRATSFGYPKIGVIGDQFPDPESQIFYEYFNITTTSDYLAGSELTLDSIVEIGAAESEFTLKHIKYFYIEDNETKFLNITLTNAGVFGAGSWTYTAVADLDIPPYLQDVENNFALPLIERRQRGSRWLKAFTRITSTSGAEYVAGIGSLYLMLKDGSEVNPVVVADGEVPVSIFADGSIYSSPLNYQMATLNIVRAGGFPYLDLPEPVTFAEIGIPFEAHMQTLPIEAGEGRTLTDDKKIVDKVGMGVYNTIGGYVGVPGVALEKMVSIKTRDNINMGEPDAGLTGYTAPIIPNEWTKEGMIKIVQVDPTPMTILSVYPKGLAGD